MLFSPACERNRVPILAVLRTWLPERARVLEIGAGSGQHALFFCQQLPGLHWQPTDREEGLADLAARIAAERQEGEGSSTLAPGTTLADPLALDVDREDHWPPSGFDAVFSANTAHIMAAASVGRLLEGAARVLRPGGVLLLYGPFHDGGVHTAASNAEFDAHLRSLDPSMGVRDALEIQARGHGLGLTLAADVAMPANNRTLILRRSGDQPG